MIESLSDEFNSHSFVDEHGKPYNQEKALHDETIKNYSQRAASGEDIDSGFRLSGAAEGIHPSIDRKLNKKKQNTNS